MRDIDVFLLLTLVKDQYGLTEDAIKRLIQEQTGILIGTPDIRQILTHRPTTKQLVQELLNRGYSQRFIATYLQISPASVSYHANTTVKREYCNPVWRNIVDFYNRSR